MGTLHSTLIFKNVKYNMEVDYLVVGAGAFAMAFIDELIHNTKDVTVVVVDKRAKPGGHWNDAYPMVRLHQPAATYGVNSRILGQGGADLASKYQILAYYEQVMEDLVATGRVRYFPQCQYVENGRFVSLLCPDVQYEVTVKKKMVDATRLTTSVPATTSPQYEVGSNVNLVPINGLADIKNPWEKYMVIGAGKTGLDALLYLLDHGVDPERICWVVSNDCWYFNRDMAEMENFQISVTGQFNGILAAENLDEMYENYEKAGIFMRIDKSIQPRKMRAATCSPVEMEKIGRIQNIVRLGRIVRIEESEILFTSGQKIPTSKKTLHIDCSAAGTSFPPVRKIFSGSTINLQMVQAAQPTFSGSVIAAVEIAAPDDDEMKNDICTPIPGFQDREDWPRLMRETLLNAEKFGRLLGFRWLRSRRLSRISHVSLFDLALVKLYMLSNQTAIIEKMDTLSK